MSNQWPDRIPRYDDPLTQHWLNYLNGGEGSGKITRAIEHFRVRDPPPPFPVNSDPPSRQRDVG